MTGVMFIVAGMIVGFAASRAAACMRNHNIGCSMLIAVVGAFGGAMLGRAMGYAASEPATFVASVLGAVAIVSVYLGIANRRMV